MEIRLSVNGRIVTVDVEPRRTLADALREDLGLTGTHLGCEHGVCGACTVMVDGQPVRACLMFAIQADGCSVTTIEGLQADDGELHALQRAFCERHGLQCGFCTPGMLISALDLLHREEAPSRERIREEMRVGKTPRAAIEAGFRRALRTIVDTHLTVMGTAVILLSFGTSSVKGFGISLFIGLGASLFTAYFFTRLLFDLLYMGRRKVDAISI